MESLMSPAVLDALGVAAIALIMVLFVKYLTGFVSAVKGKGTNPPKDWNGYANKLFEHAVPFQMHAKEQDRVLEVTCNNNTRLIELEKTNAKLVSIGEQQTSLLSKLVELRSEFIKSARS